MVQLQLLISHPCENSLVPQRAEDGFINAAAMCRLAGKKFHDYSRTKQATEFVEELARSTGIPAHLLVFDQVTGPNEHRGTWVHPDIAIHLGQWLSPKFAVMVSKWVREWMSGTVAGVNLPYHLRRYLANRGAIPYSHFSILNEMTLALIAPLEEQGYRLPDRMIPDISEGRMFSAFLRDEKNIDTKAMPTYRHKYEDGRIVDARLYPILHLGDFREHFATVWMPTRCMDYFGERDQKAIPYLAKMLGQQVDQAQELKPAPAPLPRRPAAPPPSGKGDD
jgi:hypothetical protein